MNLFRRRSSVFLFASAALLATTSLTISLTAVAQDGWTGTITMFAQGYTPNAEFATDKTLTAMQTAADAWMADHPGVTIEFVDEEFQGYNDIVRARAASGELWDVFWAQWQALNGGGLPEGIAVDLSPYFAEPNPYAPDYQTWADAMNPTIIEETRAPNGANYNINGDYVATAFFYNADLFEQAGVEALPTTWDELLAVSQQLQDAGIQPVVGVPLYSWFQRHFLSNYYADDFAAISEADGAPGYSVLDEAIATNNGTLSTADPRVLSWWTTFKDLAQYYLPDYLVQPPDSNSAAAQDFIGGNAAMYYSGSWFPNELRAAEVPFEFGSFNFPSLEGVSEFDTGHNAAGAVGGPNAAYQYAISTPEANRTMEEEGKFEVVLDWLRYLGTPDVAESIINENGSFVPTFAGTTPAEGMESLSEQAQSELIAVQIGRLSPSAENEIQSLFGLYLSGNITEEEAQTQVQDILDRSIAEYEDTNSVNLDEMGGS